MARTQEDVELAEEAPMLAVLARVGCAGRRGVCPGLAMLGAPSDVAPELLSDDVVRGVAGWPPRMLREGLGSVAASASGPRSLTRVALLLRLSTADVDPIAMPFRPPYAPHGEVVPQNGAAWIFSTSRLLCVRGAPAREPEKVSDEGLVPLGTVRSVAVARGSHDASCSSS